MKEIERKFLVKEIPNLSESKYNDMIQGYINYDPEIRIRKSDNNYFLTMKSDGALVREELETSINEVSYKILYFKILNNPIEKRRFFIPLSNERVAQLDIYHGILEGLMTVEVEFTSEEQANAFEKPVWFGEEITQDAFYKNKNLAKVEILVPENKHMKQLLI